MAQIISNEIPTGLINGVNKSYTALNDVQQITDVIMDGAEYFDFTVNGNVITLSDAPTLSIHIDYIAG